MKDNVYAGFWIRTGATLIDSILMLLIISPILTAIYGASYWTGKSLVMGRWDMLFNYVLPALVVILFWIYKSATPGKLITGITIVDAKTGGKISTGQCVGRYFAYYVSMIPLFLGFIWIAFDKRKQGWHDKLAGTVVIRNKDTELEDLLE